MSMSLYPGPRRGRTVLSVLVWILALGLGMWLVWYGFTWTAGNGQPEDTPQPVAASATPVQITVRSTAAPLPSATVPSVPAPADSPLPTVAPAPTVIPPTATTAVATIVAGADGVNVRGGPGTNYTRLGYLDPGAQAEVTGRYGDWWRIRYNETPGWVFGELVTASNVDNVPQVEPPPAPTAAPVTATPVLTEALPTATSVPAADFRGLVPDKFEIEGAPGPYALGAEIWFNMWITNQTSAPVECLYLGVWVEETGEIQKSWVYSQLPANQQFYHRDQIHDKILAPGTYNLWLAIQFTDGESVLLSGPVTVVVQ